MTALLQDEKEKKKKRPPQRGILTKIAFAMGAPLLFGVLGGFVYQSSGGAFETLLVRRSLGIEWNADEFLVSFGATLAIFSLFSLLFYYFAVRSSRWFVVPLIAHGIVTVLIIPMGIQSLQNPRILLSSVTMPDGEYQLFKDKQIGLGRGNIADALLITRCNLVGDNCELVWLVGDFPSFDRWGVYDFTMVASPDYETALRITSETGICFDVDTRILSPNTHLFYERTLPTDCTILDPYPEK